MSELRKRRTTESVFFHQLKISGAEVSTGIT